MLKSILKSNLTHICAVLVFIIVGSIYFSPQLSGYELKQQDKTTWQGMAKETMDFRARYNEEPLWTNSMFGGMPTYQISTLHPKNLMKHVDQLFHFFMDGPLKYFWLYCIGFYILLLTLKIDPWLAIVGALAFAFSSYFFIILDAGHNSKAHAIGYMAPIIAGVILAFKGHWKSGGLLTALALALQITANHIQITYYTGFVILILAVTYLVMAINEKTIPSFVKGCGVLLLALVLAVMSNGSLLWTTYEYGDYTTRGKTELTIGPDGQADEAIGATGLDKYYVTDWSYGKQETFTLLIPNAKGGASGYMSADRDLMRGVRSQFKENLAGSNHYWGDQRSTSGPVYAGAIICFLFLLFLSTCKGTLKYGLLAALLLSILLAWGKNLMPLTEFFLDYFPGYNKFRSVTIILVIAELVLPIGAMLALSNWIKDETVSLKKLFISSGALCLLLFIFYISPDSFFTFLSDGETQGFGEQAINNPAQASIIHSFTAELEALRIQIFKADVIRSLIFILLASLALFLYKKKILSKYLLIGSVGLLIVLDLWSVDKRYISNDKKGKDYLQWQTNDENNNPFDPQVADLSILNAESVSIEGFTVQVQDAMASEIKTDPKERRRTDPKIIEQRVALTVLNQNSDYRVLNLQNPFNDSRTSYFHKSIGGYHGAKFKRYQEMIEFHISNEVSIAYSALQKNPTSQVFHNPPKPFNVLNMLNTKYLIAAPAQPALDNPNALGPAWFVDKITWVENADEEIMALKTFDPSQEAVVDMRFKDILAAPGNLDENASIDLLSYEPNEIRYGTLSDSDQLAVFSEIYYDKGWQLYIDGFESEHIRANYVLRAANIPAGEHELMFRFEPQSYIKGGYLSLAGSGGIILLCLLFLIQKGKIRFADTARQVE